MKAKPLYQSLFIFFIFSALLLAYGVVKLSLSKIIVYWLAGFIAFTLVEYIFHRWLFHMNNSSTNRKKIQQAIHGNHHAAPHQMTELMMKPAIAIGILLPVTGLFYWLFSFNALAFLPGFLCGYSFYIFIHFAIHAYKPPKHFLRFLWKQHNLHHFYNDKKKFWRFLTLLGFCLWHIHTR